MHKATMPTIRENILSALRTLKLDLPRARLLGAA
jgi:hypothetical protein